MASRPNSGIAQYPVTAILAPVVIIGAALQPEIPTNARMKRVFFIFHPYLIANNTNNNIEDHKDYDNHKDPFIKFHLVYAKSR
jgi:hypothetical protein